MDRRKLLRRLAAVALAGLLLIQLVPYGRDHANPAVVKEPAWDSPATRALAVRACFDCHSNQTRWPWYAAVAPVSWLVQRDVDVGRRKLNFSEWQRSYEHAHEAAEAVTEGEMPLIFYLPLHPEAVLTDQERATLVRGLSATLGGKQSDRVAEDDD